MLANMNKKKNHKLNNDLFLFVKPGMLFLKLRIGKTEKAKVKPYDIGGVIHGWWSPWTFMHFPHLDKEQFRNPESLKITGVGGIPSS